jgi:outer membrane protein assembly factor BamB
MKRSVLATAVLALVVALVAAPHAATSSAQAAAAWPTFHGSAQRAGVSTVNGPSALVHLNIWTLPSSTAQIGTVSSFAVGPNNVGYIGANDGGLYAFDPSKGAYVWVFKTGGPIVDTPTVSGDGTRVYFGSDDGFVYSVNTQSGAKVWSVNMGSAVEGSPALSPDGSTIYVTDISGVIDALSTSNGNVQWTSSAGSGIRGSLSLSPDGTTIYAAATDGKVFGIPSSGLGSANATVFYLDGDPISSPSVDANGNIYETTTSGTVDSFSPSSSTPRWIFIIPGHIPSSSTPAIAGNNVYLGAGDGNLYSLALNSGTQQWSGHTAAAIESSPAVTADGKVYVGSDDGNLYVFDSTGKQITEEHIGGFVSSSPAVGSDGAIWIASQSGQIDRIGALAPPATPPGSPTPGPSPTPTITPTPGPTSTPAPSATATQPALSVAGKASVNPGGKQTIKVTTLPNAAVHIVVKFPNGTHQTGNKKANSAGVVTYNFHQKPGVITHSHSVAVVTVTVGSTTSTFKYKIGYGTIAVSAEPHSVAAGKPMSIYIHEKPNTRVLAIIKYSNGRVDRKTGTPGPHGWAHIKYTVPKNAPKGKTVTVTARLLHGSSKVSSTTTFTVH